MAQDSIRTYSDDHMINLTLDALWQLDSASRKPILHDPFLDLSLFWPGGNWDNSESEIHKATNYKMPILMDDNSVTYFNAASYGGQINYGGGDWYLFYQTFK